MIYLVVKLRVEGLREMYYSHGPHGLGTAWTFKIADAIWWKTNSQPRMIVSWEKEASIVSMTKQEFFKRKLMGK